ncbi:MAG: hypothetical protein NXI28_15895 [bacterium]|nr:hypothetical protein [bacterium]
MTRYYDHRLRRFSQPDERDCHSVRAHATRFAEAIGDPGNDAAKGAALAACCHFAFESIAQGFHDLTFCQTSDNYARMLVRSLTRIRTLRHLLKDMEVPDFNKVADGAVYLGFELHLLPWSLGERSILWDRNDCHGFTFRHWTTLMAACRREQTLWPNWYEAMTVSDLERDDVGDELDLIPEYRDLVFDSTVFRSRLRDNYDRCNVCIETSLDRGLSPVQLRRLMHHSDRESDILNDQKLQEYFRDEAAACEDDESPDDSNCLIAVRTDSRNRGGLSRLRERLHRASLEADVPDKQTARNVP